MMIVKLILFAVTTFIINIHNGEALRVLGLFPTPNLPHFEFQNAIMHSLVERGHHVTVACAFHQSNLPANYTLIVSLLNMGIGTVSFKKFEDNFWGLNLNDYYSKTTSAGERCIEFLQSSKVLELLRKQEHYDVIFIEQMYTDCLAGVAWIYKAPVIGLTSCLMMPWHFDRVGQVLNPSYMPTTMITFTEDMNIIFRMINWSTTYLQKWAYQFYHLRALNDFLHAFIGDPELPDIWHLIDNTSMLFINTHHALHGVRPIAPAVIELAGIQMRKLGRLEPRLREFLDRGVNGVVYVNFGVDLRTASMAPTKVLAIMDAIKAFNYTSVWRWEDQGNVNFPFRSPRVYANTWLPQKAILCHPNVRLFINHGGLMSINEAAYCGKPMVLVPMYEDHFLNANAVVSRGMGTIVEYTTIKADIMTEAIGIATSFESQKNAKAVSYLFANRSQSASEAAVYWTEYVAKTKGAPLLSSHTKEMSYIAYHQLDVYFLLCMTIPTIKYAFRYTYQAAQRFFAVPEVN